MALDIEKLLEKYYEGETSLEEERALKKFFQSDDVPAHLKSHGAQFGYFVEARKEQPSLQFNHELAMLLDPPKQGPVRRLGSWLIRIAAGLALLMVGFGAGWIFQSEKEGGQPFADLGGMESQEMLEMKKVLAFGQMNETSASERIQAVNQSYGISQVDEDITQLLVNTLNFDPNVNVRLAACQALTHFAEDNAVKEALVRSLTVQTDPIVQISLIEALVTIKEKRAVDPFRQLARDRTVLDVVRLKATEGVNLLNGDV